MNSKRTVKVIGTLLLLVGVCVLAVGLPRAEASGWSPANGGMMWGLGCVAAGIGVIGLIWQDSRARVLVRGAAIGLGLVVAAVILFLIRGGPDPDVTSPSSPAVLVKDRESAVLFSTGFALTSIALAGLTLRRKQHAGSTLAGALGVAVAVIATGAITRLLGAPNHAAIGFPSMLLALISFPLVGFALFTSAKDQLAQAANAGNRPRLDHKLSAATGTAFGLLIVCGLLVFSVEEREARDFERVKEIGRAREALYSIESNLHALDLSARNAWESRRDYDFIAFDRAWKALDGALHQLAEIRGTERLRTAAASVITRSEGRASQFKLAVNSLRPGRATYGVASGTSGLPAVSSEVDTAITSFQSALHEELAATDLFGATRRRDGMLALAVAALAIAALLCTVHVLSQRDAEARLRSELTLRRHNETLKGFAHTVAHDLRAPLRGIAGYAGELEAHVDNVNARGKHCITQITIAAQNLERLIGDTLEYAQLDAETVRMTPIQLPALVTTLLQQRSAAIRQYGALVDTQFGIESVISWERGIVQIIGNLLDNAIKYSRYAQPPRLRIETAQTPLSWRLMIYDNGIGFDMKYHDRIFGLFQRLVTRDEFEGTGAGLAIVRKITDRLGGTVCAEARPGGGATFLVELPRVLNTETS